MKITSNYQSSYSINGMFGSNYSWLLFYGKFTQGSRLFKNSLMPFPSKFILFAFC